MSLPKDNKDSIPEPVKGLEGIVAADTTLSSVNGEKGILRYRGYPIEELAGKVSFTETAFLLLYGDIPTIEQKKSFSKIASEF